MRFAITLTDRYLPVFDALLAAGWQPVKVFTSPVDDRIFHNKLSLERARQLDLPVQIREILLLAKSSYFLLIISLFIF